MKRITGRRAPSARDRAVSRVLWITLALNIVVSGLKLVFGLLSGAVSMVADGFPSLLDAAGNIVGLVGIHAARKAPDADHPYGHRKFEALASLAISILLFISCYEIVTAVFSRLGGSHGIQPTPATFAVMGVTLVINVFVTRFEHREGERLQSMILKADAKHTQSDVFASLAVVGSLVAGALEFPVVDLVVAAGLAGLIAYSGFQIVAGAFSVLSDSQVVDPHLVATLATQEEEVAHVHHVRSRGLPDDIHIDFHLHVSPLMTVARAHSMAHRAADRVKAGIPGVTDVVVHIEPDDEHEV